MKQIKTNMSLVEDEAIDAMANQLREEIDNEIMVTLLEQDKWYRVDISRFNSREHAVDIQEWIEHTLPQKSCSNFGRSFMFKEKRYAEWFSLRWL